MFTHDRGSENMVNGIVEAGFQSDGLKAISVLNRRCDTKTTAGRLSAFWDVIKTLEMKQNVDIVPGIHKWESKVLSLKSRFGEGLSDDMKLAILVGMLPKEYQDIVLQTTSVADKVKCENIRDNILNMVTQRVEMVQPRPMDIGAMRKEEEEKYEIGEEEDINAVGKGKG